MIGWRAWWFKVGGWGGTNLIREEKGKLASASPLLYKDKIDWNTISKSVSMWVALCVWLLAVC